MQVEESIVMNLYSPTFVLLLFSDHLYSMHIIIQLGLNKMLGFKCTALPLK